MSLTLLSPLGALLVLVAAVPLAAVAVGKQRIAEACRVLRLDPDSRAARSRAIAAVLATALVAAAAAQPALRTERTEGARTDAEALIVVDITRSMRAAPAPGDPTRFERAQRIAREIRNALPQVPTGVASLTDRVLPHLFPTPDRDVFEETVQRALEPERPAPSARAIHATDLGALGAIPEANLFDPSARRRLLVVVTDGESRTFDTPGVATALRDGGIHLVLVRVGNTGERVFTRRRAETSYAPDPLAGETLDSLARAAGGESVAEDDMAAAVRASRDFLGSGPTTERARGERLIPLGPFLALLALVPLAFLLGVRHFPRPVFAD